MFETVKDTHRLNVHYTGQVVESYGFSFNWHSISQQMNYKKEPLVIKITLP